MFNLELTVEEAAVLVKVLTNEAKEIHAWQCATNSTDRTKEYEGVTTLLKKLTLVRGGKQCLTKKTV